MPPVDVPAIRSNSSNTRRPDRRSNSVRTIAGIRPRIPPPSMDKTRIPVTVVATTVAVRAALLIALCCAAGLAGTALARPSQDPQPPAENPCIGPKARQPLCPDLLMPEPGGGYVGGPRRPPRAP